MRKVKAEVSARENKSETISRFTIDNLTLSDIPTLKVKATVWADPKEKVKPTVRPVLIVKVKGQGPYFTDSSKTRQSPTQKEYQWYWQK